MTKHGAPDLQTRVGAQAKHTHSTQTAGGASDAIGQRMTYAEVAATATAAASRLALSSV